ncbi:hypothetical protein [Pradoshia sp.]
MTRIPTEDRNIMEKAIYLPMVLTILTRDLQAVEAAPFKLKQPYVLLIEETMKQVQHELKAVSQYMRSHQLKVEESKRDESFTLFLFLYKGYEEYHNYFNPRIRNKVQELLEYYFIKQWSGKKDT